MGVRAQLARFMLAFDAFQSILFNRGSVISIRERKSILKTRDLIMSVMAMMLLCWSAANGQGSTIWTVDDNGPADFSNIQDAVDVAAAERGSSLVCVVWLYFSPDSELLGSSRRGRENGQG